MPAADEVAALLAGYRFVYANELELHAGIEQALLTAGHQPAREVCLTATDRIDFLLGRLGVEVKIAQAPGDVARQLRRYAATGLLDELLLVTTRVRHRAVPALVPGFPVTVHTLIGGF